MSKEASQKGEERNGDEEEKRRRVHFHEKLNYAWQREKKERRRDGWRGGRGDPPTQRAARRGIVRRAREIIKTKK